jgi:hypothetical protein
MAKPTPADDQAKRLKQQQEEAAAQAATTAAENQRLADANYRRRMGQTSLIATSELGVQDKLGG